MVDLPTFTIFTVKNQPNVGKHTTPGWFGLVEVHQDSKNPHEHTFVLFW